MRRKVVLLPALLVLALSTTSVAYAGEWFKDNGKWAYRDNNGQQVRSGWFTDVDGKVYNFNGGVVRSGWYKEGSNWYYFNPISGERQSGWIEENNAKYFTNRGGVMQAGWLSNNGKWYYAKGDGSIYTDKLLDIGGDKYYFHEDGHMATNEWVMDDTYYAGANGVIATSTWVDETYVSASGKVSEGKEESTKEVKIQNKLFSPEEYMAMAEDSVGRYENPAWELYEEIVGYRNNYNETYVYTYSGDDDNYVDNNELPEFTTDDALNKAAALRAVELASQQRASGARPDGRAADTVLTDCGVSFTKMAESVAFGQEDAEECYEDLDSGVHIGYWKTKTYERMGVGVACDADGKLYWVVLYVE